MKIKGTAIYCKATNGSGKSMVVRLLKKRYGFEERPYEVKKRVDGKIVTVKFKITYIPKIKLVALGHYRMGEVGNRGQRMWVGGCDTLQKDQILAALEYLWRKPKKYTYIYFEGQSLSDTKTTYVDAMKAFNDSWSREKGCKRKLFSWSIIPPIQLCIDRVMARNKNKKNKKNFEKLRQRYHSVIRQTEWMMRQRRRLDLNVIRSTNTKTRKELVDFFLDTFIGDR